MRILLTLIFLTLALPCNAEIYKWVDDQGNVHYGDRPAKNQKNQIITPPPASHYKKPLNKEKKPEKKAVAKKESDTKKIKATKYTQLLITQPKNDAAIRSNNGQLTIQLKTEPKLDRKAGHKIEITLDGSKVATSSSGSATLKNIDRGTHTLSAKIVDKKGKTLKTSSKQTFHLLRRSIH